MTRAELHQACAMVDMSSFVREELGFWWWGAPDASDEAVRPRPCCDRHHGAAPTDAERKRQIHYLSAPGSFSPVRWRFKRAVDAQDWPSAGTSLDRIRQIISINLPLGLIVVLIGAIGRFWG
jgi:hypothetical protein